MTCDIILAIHPRHASAILQGRKTAELRVRFPESSRGSTVYLYSTAPVSAIVGGFVVSEIAEGAPRDLWARFGDALHVEHREFASYTKGRSFAKVLRVTAPFLLRRPVPTSEMAGVALGYSSPQSYRLVRNRELSAHLLRLRYSPTSGEP